MADKSITEAPAKPTPSPIVRNAGDYHTDVDDSFMDEAARNDPELADMLKEEKDLDKDVPAKPKKGAKKPEGEGEGDSGDEGTGAGDEDDTDQGGEEEGAEDEGEAGDGDEEIAPKQPKKKEGEGESAADEDEDQEYADNVIPGVTGKAFGELPEDVRTSLAAFHEDATDAKDRLTKAQKEMDDLLNDPIIKHRHALISDGKAGLEYEIPKLSPEEKKQLVDALGLDDNEMSQAETLLNQIAEKKARAMGYNFQMREKASLDAKKEISDGRKFLLGLSKFNKTLDTGITEDDFDAIQERKERHPKWKAWNDGVGKIYNWCVSKGIKYQAAMKLKPEALYAAAAAELDLPVAPSAEVLKKITADAKQKALARFLKPSKKNEARGLSSAQGDAERRVLDKTTVQEGINLEKLASDEGYYDTQVNRKPGDQAWLNHIDALAEKGEALLKKRKK